jgi:hypothetical protein
MFGEHPYFD